MRISDYIVKYLEDINVEYVFGITGGGAAGLNDAFALSKKIKYISFHHEQGAANAAIGYSKQTEKLAVVNPTTGCGGTNCITSVMDAWQDYVPILFLSGNVPLHQTVRYTRSFDRKIGVQENDIIELVKPITKFAEIIHNPTASMHLLKYVIKLAQTGPMGPVWLDIPSDIQNKQMKDEDFSVYQYIEPVKTKIKCKEHVLNLLSKSVRPLVLAGNGIHLAKAKEEFNIFIKQYQLPVVTTYLGIDLIDHDNSLHIGSIGIKGTRAGNFAVDNCDLLLVLGCCLNIPEIGYDPSLFARNAKICIVDLAPTTRVKADTIIKSDLKEFFNELA